MTRMRAKAKIFAVVVTASLACLFMLLPTASGAGSMTLTPTAQAPGASVSIAGTGFGATRNVTVGFGNEINMTQEPTTLAVWAITPTTVAFNFDHRPIKPASFSMHIKAISGLYVGTEYDVTDDGAGSLYATGAVIFDHTLWGSIDYALGGFQRNTTFVGVTPDDYEFTASYKSYQYNNVTSFGRVTTSGSGAFSANFTVPAVANGNYNVTAVDSGGTLATATLGVSTIPEILPFGAILLLSSLAVIAGSWHFRKRPRITK